MEDMRRVAAEEELRQMLKSYRDDSSVDINVQRLRDLLQYLTPDQWYNILKSANRAGRTVIHWAAERGNTELINGCLLEYLTEEQRYTLLSAEDGDRYSAVAIAAKKNNTAVLEQLLHCIPEGRRYELLKSESADWKRALHVAARKRHTETVSCILSCMSSEHQHELLITQDSLGNTALSEAAHYGRTETVKCMLSCMSSEHQQKLLITQNSRGNTALGMAAYNGHTETVRCILDSLTPENQVKVIMLQNNAGFTPAYRAAEENHPDTLQCILSCTPPECHIELLTKESSINEPNTGSESIICMAAYKGYASVIKGIKSCVMSENWLEILNKQDSKGDTALHKAAHNCHVAMCKTMLCHLKPEQQIALLNTQNNDNHTVIDKATRSSSHKKSSMVNHLRKFMDTASKRLQASASGRETSRRKRRAPSTISSIRCSSVELSNSARCESTIAGETVRLVWNEGNLIFPFVETETVGAFTELVGKETESLCSILDTDESRYTSMVRLSMLRIPFILIIGDTRITVSADDSHRQHGEPSHDNRVVDDSSCKVNQEDDSTNLLKSARVSSAKKAVELLTFIHEEVSSGRSQSVNKALKYVKKDLQTAYRFRHIYYLHVLDEGKLQELNTSWIHSRKRDGLQGLDKMAEEAVNWEQLIDLEAEGKVTIFGKQRS